MRIVFALLYHEIQIFLTRLYHYVQASPSCVSSHVSKSQVELASPKVKIVREREESKEQEDIDYLPWDFYVTDIFRPPPTTEFLKSSSAEGIHL